MTETVNQSLQKIAKGTGIILFGTAIGMLLGFGNRVLLARYFTQSEYGIFSLAFVVLNIACVIATLGLRQGATRQIAFYRGKGDSLKVQGLVSSSLEISFAASIVLAVIIFFTSGIISTKVFHEPGLAPTLKIVSIAIPFFVLIQILTAIFRGFNDVKPRVYFQNILRGGLFLLLLLAVALLGLSFTDAMYAFSASFVLAFAGFAIYGVKKAPFQLKREQPASGGAVRRELLLLSLPLLGTSMLGVIMQRTDILMLGYFTSSQRVGLYNGALPLARLIPLTLSSMGFLYVPVMSQLYSQNLLDEMKRSYQVLTKWIFSMSFPLFLILFIFPHTVLSFFFGTEYSGAALALQILSAGLIFHTFLGANGMTLLIFGKTRLLMWTSLLGAGLNVVLNVSLIPQWGIVGAAVASLLSFSAVNTFNSTKLYQLSRIHPFTKDYLKPISLSSAILLVIYALSHNLLAVRYWMLPIIFVLFLAVYALALLVTRSFDKEDISLLLAIEKRTGVDAKPLKKVLQRFI